ncbi:hypothetical protein LguiA_004447 [Lonicera macranthoides]
MARWKKMWDQREFVLLSMVTNRGRDESEFHTKGTENSEFVDKTSVAEAVDASNANMEHQICTYVRKRKRLHGVVGAEEDAQVGTAEVDAQVEAAQLDAAEEAVDDQETNPKDFGEGATMGCILEVYKKLKVPKAKQGKKTRKRLNQNVLPPDNVNSLPEATLMEPAEQQNKRKLRSSAPVPKKQATVDRLHSDFSCSSFPRLIYIHTLLLTYTPSFPLLSLHLFRRIPLKSLQNHVYACRKRTQRKDSSSEPPVDPEFWDLASQQFFNTKLKTHGVINGRVFDSQTFGTHIV